VEGYDLGGAEYPYDASALTVVDILKPDDSEQADWMIRDLSQPSWTDGLEPRERIYIGKTLRYLPQDRMAEFASEIRSVHEVLGSVVMFDWMRVIEPVMTWLLCNGYVIVGVELINPPFDDGDEEGGAEYQVELVKQA
jgi:hypothetical protein